jgi:DNA-directed RNA polymerase specialized sigma24 family protein
MKLAAPARMQLRAVTRPRRSAPAVATPAANPGARGRIAGALRACTLREQLVLVLLLYEQLTPSEAAATLGLTPRQVERAYFTALADLQCALRGARNGRRSRAIARRSLVVAARLRKAS